MKFIEPVAPRFYYFWDKQDDIKYKHLLQASKNYIIVTNIVFHELRYGYYILQQPTTVFKGKKTSGRVLESVLGLRHVLRPS